jgi:hypothetical protein
MEQPIMSDEERPDFRTRFKKGQSGNPRGRPRGSKNKRSLLVDVLYRPIQVKDSSGTRSVPKIVAATEVCINNAIKGDLRSYVKIMEIAQKFQLLEKSPHDPEQITEIRETIVDPKVSDIPIDFYCFFGMRDTVKPDAIVRASREGLHIRRAARYIPVARSSSQR